MDLALCENKKCPRRHECYRYLAIPDEWWNNYSDFDHRDCNAFIEIKDRPINKNKLKEKDENS
jgi:hypothetical protein